MDDSLDEPPETHHERPVSVPTTREPASGDAQVPETQPPKEKKKGRGRPRKEKQPQEEMTANAIPDQQVLLEEAESVDHPTAKECQPAAMETPDESNSVSELASPSNGASVRNRNC